MRVAILLHASGREPAAIRLARAYPDALVYLGLEYPQAGILRDALGPDRVVVCGDAFDTLTETFNVLPVAIRAGVTGLFVVTEAGHLGRAAMIARILAFGRGVRIVPVAAARTSYQSPRRVVLSDLCRAVVARVTGRVFWPSP